MRSRIFSSLLLLQLGFLTLQAPVKLPEAGSSGAESGRQEVGPIKLPPDLDLENTTISQLVKLRPNKNEILAGRLYKNYFANHSEVRKINLHDTNTAKTAQQIINLSNGKGKRELFDYKMKHQLTASIRHLIEDTKFANEQHRIELKNDLQGARVRNQRLQYIRAKRKAAATSSEMASGGQDMSHQAEGGSRQPGGGNEKRVQKRRKSRRRVVQIGHKTMMLDRPLSYHLKRGGRGQDWTAREVEGKIREWGHLYSSNRILTRKFAAYMKQKHIPPEEYDAIMGRRISHVRMAGLARKKTARFEQLAASSASASAHPSGASGSHSVTPLYLVDSSAPWLRLNSAALSQHPPSATIHHAALAQQYHHHPSPPLQTHEDFTELNKKADWKWFSTYLRDA